MIRIRRSLPHTLLLVTALFAADLTAAAHAQATNAVTTPVAALDAALDRIQRSDSGSFEARAQILGPVVDQAYDLEAIARASIGTLRYMQLSDDKKKEFLSVFRDFTVASYLSNFKKGSNAKFVLKPDVRDSEGTSKIVQTTIGPADNSSDPTEIDYVVRPEGGSWKIVDVQLLGHISQAGKQHSDFASTLASGGVDGLITVLNKKIKTFSQD